MRTCSVTVGYRMLPVLLGLVLLPPCVVAQAKDQANASAPSGIGGKGRIVPSGGLLSFGATQAGQVVERVLVREGDRVKKGDVILVFVDKPMREAERDAAADRLKQVDELHVARMRVLELERQSAKLSADAAAKELQAVSGLDDRTVSPREQRQRAQMAASSELALRLADARIAEAKVAADQERRLARAHLETARAQLSRSQVVAPRDATVIEVSAFGTGVSAAGTGATGQQVTLADTSAMYVTADFFEGDIARITPGAKVRITNPVLSGGLTGTVEQVGRIVNASTRLGKASIRLDQPSPADRYIGMQVDVVVSPGPAAK